MFDRTHEPRALSLVEVLIFTAILAILAAVLFPSWYASSDYAKLARARKNLQAVEAAVNLHVRDWGGVPADLNDSHQNSLSLRVRSATQPVCTLYGEVPSKSDGITFRNNVEHLGHYSPSIHCPLTSPTRYLDRDHSTDPFSNGSIPIGYDSKETDMAGAPIILYGAFFSAGPDRIAGDWRGGPTTGGALAYCPTNGLRSSGELWGLVPNPVKASDSSHLPPGFLQSPFFSWEFYYPVQRNYP